VACCSAVDAQFAGRVLPPLRAAKKKAATPGCRFPSFEVRLWLKDKTRCQLHLPGGIRKVAVGIRYRSVICLIRECWSGGGPTDSVSGRIFARGILMIEEIESLADQLDAIPVVKAEMFRGSQIHYLAVGQPGEVTLQHGNSLSAARTIDA
jgi:hypothetical protein